MRFWTWALEAYARPQVAEACLDLQDSHRQSVLYLLWAAWAAADGRVLDDKTLQTGARLASEWEDAAVGPLRLARRGLKTLLPGVAGAEREALRAEVKVLELRTEQAVMLALEAMSPPSSGAALPLEPALIGAGAVWAVAAPREVLLHLARVLA